MRFSLSLTGVKCCWGLIICKLEALNRAFRGVCNKDAQSSHSGLWFWGCLLYISVLDNEATAPQPKSLSSTLTGVNKLQHVLTNAVLFDVGRHAS